MKLVVIGKPIGSGPPGAPVEIRVVSGRLRVDARDEDARATVDALVRRRYFKPGLGFPRFEKIGADFACDPNTNKLVPNGFVGMEGDERAILQAIADNFAIGEQFDVTLVDDVPETSNVVSPAAPQPRWNPGSLRAVRVLAGNAAGEVVCYDERLRPLWHVKALDEPVRFICDDVVAGEDGAIARVGAKGKVLARASLADAMIAGVEMRRSEDGLEVLVLDSNGTARLLTYGNLEEVQRQPLPTGDYPTAGARTREGIFYATDRGRVVLLARERLQTQHVLIPASVEVWSLAPLDDGTLAALTAKGELLIYVLERPDDEPRVYAVPGATALSTHAGGALAWGERLYQCEARGTWALDAAGPFAAVSAGGGAIAAASPHGLHLFAVSDRLQLSPVAIAQPAHAIGVLQVR